MRHGYILYGAKIEFLFDVSTLLVAQYKLEKTQKDALHCRYFFTTVVFRDNFYCTFITFSCIERNFPFFSRARNYFFTTVVFAIDDRPVSAKSVYQFPRVLCASLRCITVAISRVLEAIEKIDEWCDELGGVSCLARKSETKPIDPPPPSMMMAVALVVAHRVFRHRVPAVFLALFNNCALSLDAISCFSSGSFHPQTLLIRSCQRNFRDQRKVEKYKSQEKRRQQGK